MPDAEPEPKVMDISGLDLPDAKPPQAQQEQTPQLPENPLSGKKILRIDLSDLPRVLPVHPRTLRVDLSDLPNAETPAVTPSDQQKEKPEDSWLWQTLESCDPLQPYAQKMREYLLSPTDTKGIGDWLTSTVPKSAAQLGVSLAKMPFDLTQTFSSESQAAIEKFLLGHPEYEQFV